MSFITTFRFIHDEIGLSTLRSAGYDVYAIILVRMIRLIGFGSTSLILALYLKQLVSDESYIGYFMTLTFLGDLISSFYFSLITDQVGRKKILVLCSVLMVITGVVFGILENYYVLCTVAFLGIMTPSGGEVGPFRTIEQSAIAKLCQFNKDRSDIYSWYTFLGMFCGAIGSAFAGVIIDLTKNKLEYTELDSYKAVFWVYAGLGVISTILCLTISPAIEPTKVLSNNGIDATPSSATEATRLIENETEDEIVDSTRTVTTPKKSFFTFLPQHLSTSTYIIIVKICFLFGLDSFASSLTPLSWQSFYFKHKFDISSSFLGSVFFTTGLISGITSLASTSMTKRLGAVITMAATHLPASFLLTMIPIPLTMQVTLAILILRSSIQSMDVAPKHVFLAALVPDEDRTAVFGFVNVVKTLAQIIGPSIVGVMTKNGLQWLTFIIAGSLKIVYDLGVLFTFMTYNRHSEH
ncbi:conserved hypothetical protein [Lodderomyces elongisporus NRRL YB-4239]|uniref:Major facilitator superfamily (MFS) profile domain-containing protein n=1 Tax=Lodderomyces elongisporus (strain ATCC 11503 / CBS 2605 / JCM 1781 / NBRC 1676 / NRRL YB-4239) TaxID=379508 RepID=A5DU54_LODEL|nr:conserved hypothetical protein [Lodderomyces elongisporus NRRL YB-4239]